MSREVVIVSACRTAIASFNGSLQNVSAIDLGATVMAEAVKRAGVDGSVLDEVIFGCVLQAGLGQNVARQAMIKAGLPQEVTAMTINKVCGSGLRTVSLAAQIIKAGDAEAILAGGMENMSASPFSLDKARTGYRMGPGVLNDLMIKDGLWEAFNNYHMGVTAENINDQWKNTREEQDALGFRSQDLANNAIESGRFKDEIVPVVIKNKKGDQVFDTDEFPRRTTLEKMAGLKPAFKKDGSVTA